VVPPRIVDAYCPGQPLSRSAQRETVLSGQLRRIHSDSITSSGENFVDKADARVRCRVVSRIAEATRSRRIA